MVTTALMAFTSGALLLAGGLAAALTTVPTAHLPTAHTALTLTLCTVAVIAGLILLRWGQRLPRWTYHAVVAGASGMLATGVLISADEPAALTLAAIFVFCALDILYYFHGRAALIHLVLFLLAVAASLTARGVHPATTLALLLVQVAVIIVIGRLVDRAAESARDALTGLPNRRGFDERLDKATTAAGRSGSPLSVALVDVDHFKTVNDRDGHPAGDALLRGLATAWSAHLPQGVWLTRQGGDEFALLAPGRTAADLAHVCEQLHTLAAPTTISVGVAELGYGEDGALLVRRADSALYAAKAAGRACTRTADASQDSLSADLAAAVAAEDITVALQPIVTPGSGELVAVEALARWAHPRLGSLSPTVFVPLAERTGQISALGALVLHRACQDAVRLQRQLGRAVPVSVNISGHQLIEARFLEDLVGALHASGLAAPHLILEVTESSIEIASSAARSMLHRVRELGVAVAIDDFGTGYSAFSQLDTLPADYLKLDAGFTAETTSPRRTAMLKALLELSRDLGMTVVAEGVETVEQAHLLHTLGCPLVQGYYYARPSALVEQPSWSRPQRQLDVHAKEPGGSRPL